jgi:hypothetical protein
MASKKALSNAHTSLYGLLPLLKIVGLLARTT